MGEQNRRAVEAERTHDEAPDDGRALGVDADERQTRRQAPDGAGPGEGAEDDSIG